MFSANVQDDSAFYHHHPPSSMCWKKTNPTNCFQFLLRFSPIQILHRNVLISSTMTSLLFYFAPLFTEIVQLATPTPRQLWIYVPLR